MIYHAWARHNKNWRLVGVGGSAEEAYRALSRWIRAQDRPPVASAVLPAGTRPEAQGGAGGTPSRR
jgi:hypothetical protein